jgi:hypothetical protein
VQELSSHLENAVNLETEREVNGPAPLSGRHPNLRLGELLDKWAHEGLVLEAGGRQEDVLDLAQVADHGQALFGGGYGGVHPQASVSELDHSHADVDRDVGEAVDLLEREYIGGHLLCDSFPAGDVGLEGERIQPAEGLWGKHSA